MEIKWPLNALASALIAILGGGAIYSPDYSDGWGMAMIATGMLWLIALVLLWRRSKFRDASQIAENSEPSIEDESLAGGKTVGVLITGDGNSIGKFRSAGLDEAIKIEGQRNTVKDALILARLPKWLKRRAGKK